LLRVFVGFILITPLTLGQINVSGSSDELQHLTTQLQQSPGDQALREKIIKLAFALTPKPAPPAAVDEQVGAAAYAFKNATSESDLVAAAQLYAKAALLAPWVPDYYFNEGVTLEKAKRFDAAIAAFNWYLVAAPNAQDAKDVRERIGGLKFASQKAAEALAAQAAQQAEQDNMRKRAQEQVQQRLLESLLGNLSISVCVAGLESRGRGGCNQVEKDRGMGYGVQAGYESNQIQFALLNDGTVTVTGLARIAGCGTVFGVARGPAISDIRWEERKDASKHEIYSEAKMIDGKPFITISCDRPLVGADPNVRYNYVDFWRTSGRAIGD
jgi:tetratricopeptide (TPR) repeat protein